MTESFRGRIGILGAGALGGFYGARLARAGHDVHFLLRSDYDAVKRDGLFVTSYEGDFHIRPPVYASAEELGLCDLLIIGLKTTANVALPELLKPTAGPHTLVLTLQNGFGNEQALARALSHSGPDPASRVLGGIAFIASNRTAPGHINHMAHGWIRMGEFGAPVTGRTHAIAALFESAGIRCEVYDNLMLARWEKLVWNIPFNGLGVALGTNVQQVMESPELRQVARTLMDETVAAANACGVPVDKNMAEQMLKNSEAMGPYRSSMQIDYENGQKLEIESKIGEPLRHGLAAGAVLPMMQMLYALVKYKDDQN